MKFLCTGDLHLGAGAALGRSPGDRLRDQEAVLHEILLVACDRSVDAILVAGDVFEGPLVAPEQLHAFAHFVDMTRQAGREIVAISGNSRHDAAMREVNGLNIFRHVPGVHIYSRPAIHHLDGCSIACMPWVSPARLIAQDGGDVDRDRVNDRAAALLVQVATGLALEADSSKSAVLMLHGSISGASLPTGISTDDLREPVLPVDELLELGYDAIVASHIHVPQHTRRFALDAGWRPVEAGIGSFTPHDETDAVAFYTGSPLPLNFGETGVPHGVWILDVQPGVTDAGFVPIDSRPLRQVHFDLVDNDNFDRWLEAATDHPQLISPEVVGDAIVKLRIRATRAQQRRLDTGRLRDAVLTAGAHTVKIEIDTVREERARVDGVTEDLDPLKAFDAWAAATSVHPELAARVREQMEADLEAVGA